MYLNVRMRRVKAAYSLLLRPLAMHHNKTEHRQCVDLVFIEALKQMGDRVVFLEVISIYSRQRK